VDQEEEVVVSAAVEEVGVEEVVTAEEVGGIRTITDHHRTALVVVCPRLALSLWLVLLVSDSWKSKTFLFMI
jgi:hypothetical protein